MLHSQKEQKFDLKNFFKSLKEVQKFLGDEKFLDNYNKF